MISVVDSPADLVTDVAAALVEWEVKIEVYIPASVNISLRHLPMVVADVTKV